MTGRHRVLNEIEEYNLGKGAIVTVQEKVLDSIVGYRCEFPDKAGGYRVGFIKQTELCEDAVEERPK